MARFILQFLIMLFIADVDMVLQMLTASLNSLVLDGFNREL